VKLSDYVIEFLAKLGIKHVFVLPGGAAMHLNDSLGKSPDVTFVGCLHEQACAIAAEAYARVTNNFGAAMVTAGPGGTNAVTGVAAAWLDSTPCIFLSGQVKRADLKGDSGVRQLGVQEIDIVSIVRSITKYAVTVIDPDSIRFHLEKAAYLAKSGRPAPVWLDLPLDVQAATIDPAKLTSFSPVEIVEVPARKTLEQQVGETLSLLTASQRPVILVGNGIRLARAEAELLRLIEALGVPVLTTWLGLDLIDNNHPLLVGRPGAMAPRGANFALQNSDLLLTIGARLDMPTTGYAHDRFARAAKKVMVDIDPAEMQKMRTPIDLAICSDAGDFLREILRQIDSKPAARKNISQWVARCKGWRRKYPIVQPEHYDLEKNVSTYVFSDVLSEEMSSTDIVVPMSAGAGAEMFFLALKVKLGQRVFHNRGTGSMGLALPASIGACMAGGGRRTICIEGDGGIQLNIQELETIIQLKLPIKIFVLSNQGYSSIRASQKRYFGKLAGADETSGLSLPNIIELGKAYGYRTERIGSTKEVREKVRAVLNSDGPCLCEVLAPPDEIRGPAISSRQLPDGSMASTTLEDLWPFLDREEFLSNMIIPTID
jgi:acetolactate synthase I/II/III large subunit